MDIAFIVIGGILLAAGIYAVYDSNNHYECYIHNIILLVFIVIISELFPFEIVLSLMTPKIPFMFRLF
jgi:hypothetical protein